jgi:hypothetical protein
MLDRLAVLISINQMGCIGACHRNAANPDAVRPFFCAECDAYQRRELFAKRSIIFGMRCLGTSNERGHAGTQFI